MRITAARWRKYGHDRTYLTDAAGNRLGWFDNATETLHVEDEAARPELEGWVAGRAVQAEADAQSEAPGTDELAPGPPLRSVAEPAARVPTPIRPGDGRDRPAPDGIGGTAPDGIEGETEAAEAGGVAPPAWRDLSGNRAGQAAREQAEAHLAEMRGRSTFWTGVARVLDVKTDERAWRVGAKGEEAVGSRLEKLVEHGWHIIHSIPVGERGSDIDHLLIGPGGVWTLNTKNHPGKSIWVSPRQVRVGGQVVPYLRNSEFEATRVARLLAAQLDWEPPVRSALVFLTGTFIPDVTIKQMPANVVILDRMDIPGYFRRSKPRLTAEQVATVYEIARRSTTWTPGR